MATIVYESPTGIRETDVGGISYDERTRSWEIDTDDGVRMIPRERLYYIDRAGERGTW